MTHKNKHTLTPEQQWLNWLVVILTALLAVLLVGCSDGKPAPGAPPAATSVPEVTATSTAVPPTVTPEPTATEVPPTATPDY